MPLINFLKTSTEFQVAELAQTARFVREHQNEYSPGQLTSFGGTFAGKNNKYDIGIQISTEDGIVTELKSYSPCSVVGVCPVDVNGSHDEDFNGVKALSEKKQFQLTGQLGSYLSAIEVTDNASISYIFDARKLHSTYGHGEYSEEGALKAIKEEFQKVFLQRDVNGNFELVQFLQANNPGLLND